MRRSNIGKTLAANRSRKSKIMPGMMGMSAMKASPATAIPGGTSAAMKKGGVAKKPKVGIAIMIAVGKKKGKK
jgi:hypothetical protein